MNEKLEESPGLATDFLSTLETSRMVSEAERNLILHEGSTIGKVNAEPRKHRKTRNVPSSSANKVNAMSLAQRAEALAKRKVQSYRVIVRVDEETYSGLVDLGERANMKVEDAAFRAMREGLRKYADLAPRALEDEGLSDIPLGERLSRPHDEDLSAFRSSQATGEDLEQKKAFVKAIGLQTHG